MSVGCVQGEEVVPKPPLGALGPVGESGPAPLRLFWNQKKCRLKINYPDRTTVHVEGRPPPPLDWKGGLTPSRYIELWLTPQADGSGTSNLLTPWFAPFIVLHIFAMIPMTG